MGLKRILCDKCGYEFGIDRITIRSQMIDKDQGVNMTFFRCPKCKKKYVTMVSDPELRRLIENRNKGTVDKKAVFDYEAELKERYRDKLE